jgi:hypothetical protein
LLTNEASEYDATKEVVMRTIKKTRMFVLSLTILLIGLSLNDGVAGIARAFDPPQPQEFSYTLTQLPENQSKYSIVISGSDERMVSGNFSVQQLQILKALMNEAEKFALTDESIGTRNPVTTRFMDRREPAFRIDVEKFGNQSRLFLTLKSEIGRITAEAGKLNRITKREEGFFFDLLERLDKVLPKQPAQPSK